MYSTFFHLYPAVAEVPPDCLISKLKQLGGRSKCLIKRQIPNPHKKQQYVRQLHFQHTPHYECRVGFKQII